MCGRFVSTHSAEQIATYFGASFEGEAPPENFNVAPTDDILAVVKDGDHLAVKHFQWGLVPIWAKDVKIGASMINARSETIAEKPAFRRVFEKYRCIIPMDGFYEWQAAAAGGPLNSKGKPIKQPVFVHRVDDEPLAVAGVWSVWRDKNGPRDAPWLHTCAVITTSANELMSTIHDRMPVILPQSAWASWLDPTTDDVDALKALLAPAPADLLTLHKVSTDVNNVRNTGAQLILSLDDDARPGSESRGDQESNGQLVLGSFEAGQLPLDL